MVGLLVSFCLQLLQVVKVLYIYLMGVSFHIEKHVRTLFFFLLTNGQGEREKLKY